MRGFAVRTREALIEAMGRALSAVTSPDARGSFAHCGYYGPWANYYDRRFREGNAFAEGRVTCLRVCDGNAVVKGRIDKTSDGDLDFEGLFVEFHAFDSGGAKGKRDEPGLDIITDSSGCGEPTGGTTEPILKCSIVVRDTPNL